MAQTIFFPPKHKDIAEHISLRTPAEARRSVKWLERQWKKADRRRRRILLWSAVLAMNRAKVAARKKNLSAKEKKEFRQIAKIYKRFVDSHRLSED